MCGIAGKLSWNRPPQDKLIRAMTDKLEHRGPDAEGFYLSPCIGLGHRRLSILDLSEAGKQPMTDVTGKFWITFNGEIYNYQEIRKELEVKHSARFKSQTDTEVILEGYKAWGIEILKKLNGMFAFGLWDVDQKRLFLARDRLGEKPLFYFPTEGGVVFASEVKALMEDPEVSSKLNFKAINQYFSLNYLLSDQSIIEGVKKVQPGTYLLFQQGKSPVCESYWDLAQSFHNKRKITEPEAAEELKALLDDAVKIRMISDVPLGAFLSGGIDSSAVVSAMTRNSDRPENVKTFSIGFHEKSYSELPEAQFAASYLKVSHYDQIVNGEMAQNIHKIVYYADEPFADTSMVPTYYLSQFARDKVTVALTGDGGDELFAGYETYLADKIHQLSRRFHGPLTQLIEKVIHKTLPVTFDKVSLDYKMRKFFAGNALSPDQAHCFWRSIFSDSEKADLIQPTYREAVLSDHWMNSYQKYFNEVEGCHYLDQAMYVDIKTWLVDDILVKSDRMSMAHSLELRPPFLDHRLVEFAASLPVNLKLKGFQKKYILKKSLESVLPKEILYRKKRGFNAPVSHWLNQDLFQTAQDLLDRSHIQKLIHKRTVDQIFESHLSGKQDQGHKLFGILNLATWLAHYESVSV